MAVLVDDLLRAYQDGYAVRDTSLPPGDPNRNFRMRAILLYWIGDYQGQGKIANMKHSGKRACHWCHHLFRKGLGTTGSNFADNNRRYTPPDSPLRGDEDYGVDRPEAEENRPPAPRTHAEIWATGMDLTCGNHNDQEKKRIQKETGIDGLCALGFLPLFDLALDICLDLMHVLKNIWQEHLLKVFGGKGAPKKPTRGSYTNKTDEEKEKIKRVHQERLTLFYEVSSVPHTVHIHT
jgi:hypothetical protein